MSETTLCSAVCRVCQHNFYDDIKLRISSAKFTFLLAPPSETTLLLLNCPSNENIAIQTAEVFWNYTNLQTFQLIFSAIRENNVVMAG